MTTFDFLEKVLSSPEGPEWPKNKVFGVLTKILSIHMYFFWLKYERSNGLLLSAKTKCLGKIWLFSYDIITYWPIRMQDSLNYNISQTTWGLNLNFCMWLDIHGSNKFAQTFRVGVVEHACACPKVMPNFESASSQEWVERKYASWFLHVVTDSWKLRIC